MDREYTARLPPIQAIGQVAKGHCELFPILSQLGDRLHGLFENPEFCAALFDIHRSQMVQSPGLHQAEFAHWYTNGFPNGLASVIRNSDKPMMKLMNSSAAIPLLRQ